ncbi:protein SPA1-RELATED 2-like [Gastrolobium bilobum]|uniref:protein SPA1-RELATED 2-like n=1 Tax=Gastrolobium bilobum TaxID=150636 RepID=UPI002AB2D913|nr:protein SPA1-RELATED 2-like [Gastrolobium bilobum]
MDEELVDEGTRLGVDEGVQYQNKDEEYSLNPECHKILKPQEIHNDYSQIPQGKNVVEAATGHVAASEHLRPSHFLDDAGTMVEELTVKSYNGSSLDIGTSNIREPMYNSQSQWRHLYQLAGDSAMGNSLSDGGYRNSVQATSSVREDIGPTSFPERLARKSLSDDQSNVMEHLTTVEHKAEHKEDAGDACGGIRTKIISKSGFAEYFIKNTLKGKGIVCKGPSSNGSCVESRDQNLIKAGIGTQIDSNVSLSSGSKTAKSPHNATAPRSGGSDCDGVTLREWLKAGRRKGSKTEHLIIFRKIVDLVDDSHSQGFVLHNLCPSYIKLLPSNQVMYLGLPIQKQTLDSVANSEVLQLKNSFNRKGQSEHVISPSLDMRSKKQKFNENVRVVRDWSQCPLRSDLHLQIANDIKVNAFGSQDYCNEYKEDIQFSKHNNWRMSSIPHISNAGQLPLASLNERLEDKWYTSPEGGCTTSSNIYCLGVLFFELLSHFNSERAHISAMSDLRHRILPSVFLSENPKEAGFCLWMLHPEASSRPTIREILQSEVINGMQEVYSEELLSSLDQDDAESELLLHFLNPLKEQKHKDAYKLVEEIQCLESDIQEVERRHDLRKSLVSYSLQNDSSCQIESASINEEPSSSETLLPISTISNANELRLTRNICQLENAYFSMRSKIKLPETDAATHPDKDILRNCENWYVAQKDKEQREMTDTLGAFFDGLCKYARYSKFEVRGVLRNADFNNPAANVICSLGFDRDEDYFAAAGISKKIKIFEFNALLNDSVNIHYPVVEMSNRSRLSCVCWNNYIKNYLATTDYDGIVKLWDASTGQGFSQFTEHEKRAWSVDFSRLCPTKFASGSDDCSVKLWSISERNCLGTIKNVANVCCVQFSSHSSHLLAFGSADYSTYCYDLRNLRSPWCVLAGHRKAVSYVKFLDSETLVSASTDNTLKIWDLNKTSPVGPSSSACSLTLSGHTNEKNFVGLSVADGYIACGSETNEVYAYYRSLPMPVTSHKFGSTDPISGKETDDDNGQFVSSVCWRGKSDMIIAANSSGCIKVLQMV